jgi:uncharacterized protein YndB with AHSA1/START domain
MSTSSGTATVTLPTDTQILIRRRFQATPARVFRVWSTPELVQQWWSGHHGTTTSVEMDFRVGGRWRYVMSATDGSEVAFHGEYVDIVQDRKIVYTEVYEAPGNTSGDDSEAPVNTVMLEPDGDGTLFMLRVECGSKELRDMIMNSGMESGLQGQMDIIDQLVRSRA